MAFWGLMAPSGWILGRRGRLSGHHGGRAAYRPRSGEVDLMAEPLADDVSLLVEITCLWRADASLRYGKFKARRFGARRNQIAEYEHDVEIARSGRARTTRTGSAQS